MTRDYQLERDNVERDRRERLTNWAMDQIRNGMPVEEANLMLRGWGVLPINAESMRKRLDATAQPGAAS